MKNLSIVISLLVCSLAFYSCGDKEENEPNIEIIEEEPEPKPTWQTPNNLHYSSMTIIIDEKALPVGVATNEEDLLGAFVGDQCRGFIAPIKDIDGLYRYYLLVHATTDDVNNNDLKVELRYYSAQKAKLYVSKTFPFEYDGRLGSISKSFVPEWK